MVEKKRITVEKLYFCASMKFTIKTYRNFAIHFIIWFGYSLLLFYGPSMIMDTATALKFSLRTLVVNVAIFYINTYVLLPRYLGKSKYLRYILGVIILVVPMAFFYHYTEQPFRGAMERYIHRTIESEKQVRMGESESIVQTDPNGLRVPPEEFERDIYRRPPGKPHNVKVWPFAMARRRFSIGFLPSFGMLFISTIFWFISETRRRKQRELTLVNQTLVNEMKFLKSQMNPHFLFNALNNIYSLSHTNSIKAPEMILKLSEMLRYVLYESEEKKVMLGKEVDYLKNYIEFQRVKIEGIPNLRVDIERADRTLMIEPMLLIPFVENSFKHSKMEDTEKGWMEIELISKGSLLTFTVRNGIPKAPVSRDKNSGIGIENVKRRLQHLYPDKHKLMIRTEESVFVVVLKIDLA
ncbi:histidine kinase [Marinilabiliaceae bacterium JC017]|nr:histidine kinase [Marinilabiliaceae bacterium JC017]